MDKKILNFRTTEAAMEYAENLGKNDYDIVEIDGKKTFICSTSLPLERFRSPIETIVENFLKEMGMDDENEIYDISNYIGAEMSSQLMTMIENHTPYGIESAMMNF